MPNYDAQLIFVFDDDLLQTGCELQNKWERKQRSAMSSVVLLSTTMSFYDGQQRIINGQMPRLSERSRVYLVGHGMLDKDGSVPVFSRHRLYDPTALATVVGKVLQLCHADRVDRICLFACYGGSASETHQTRTTGSYAEKFARAASGLCNTVSAYMATVRIAYETGSLMPRKVTGNDNLHRGANERGRVP